MKPTTGFIRISHPKYCKYPSIVQEEIIGISLNFLISIGRLTIRFLMVLYIDRWIIFTYNSYFLQSVYHNKWENGAILHIQKLVQIEYTHTIRLQD